MQVRSSYHRFGFGCLLGYIGACDDRCAYCAISICEAVVEFGSPRSRDAWFSSAAEA